MVMSLSGANNVPVGVRGGLVTITDIRPTTMSLLNPAYMHHHGIKREIEESESARAERKKKKKSRWGGDEHEKAFIPGMPTIIPGNLDKNQEEAYLLQLQIEEISRRLRTGDLGIPLVPEERSPSPEPIYNHEGKRLNTREYRTRKKLEDDRHAYITKMLQINLDYKPPADYKPPIQRVNDKVMIPQEEHPDINFIGLLIGPRGNTLKSMEKETGAKIIIRGKGSVKEGKVGRKDGQPLPGEDEPLHAFVTAQNPESVKKAVDRIKEIIRQGIEVPEGQNDLRRMQLRELALLNGTLRENDGPRCSNCGANTHRSWQCPDKPNVTSNVVCTICGGAGHIAKDCRQRRPGSAISQATDPTKIDEEYMSLMAELGEGPPPKRDGKGDKTRFSGRGLFDPRPVPRAIMSGPPVRQDAPPEVRNISLWEKSVPIGPQPAPYPTTPNFSTPSGQNAFTGPSAVANGPVVGPLPNIPPSTSQPPPIMQSWQQQQPQPSQPSNQSNSQGRYNVPPGSMLSGIIQQPPPSSPSQQWMSPPPWMAGPPPGPVPPPPRASAPNTTAPPPWQAPPPPPGTSTRPNGANVDINALAQAGLPNLLAAPPPPPPQ